MKATEMAILLKDKNMINSRSLNDLHPTVAKMAQEFIKKCKAQGIDLLVTSTYRDSASQQALYNQGRTTPGNIVTNAKPGQSWHNWRCALDFAPIKNGKIDWNDTKTFTKCGEIAESCGFSWAGRWKGRLRELAHVQYTAGMTLADFQAGKRLP